MDAYLDTAPVIYLIENVAPWEAAVRAFLNRDGVTPRVSLLTRLECRVKPLRLGDTAVLKDYQDFFEGLSEGLLPLSAAVFDKAADLRARYNFRTPDALHLATAITAQCEAFLTNDAQLVRCQEIRIELLRP